MCAISIEYQCGRCEWKCKIIQARHQPSTIVPGLRQHQRELQQHQVGYSSYKSSSISALSWTFWFSFSVTLSWTMQSSHLTGIQICVEWNIHLCCIKCLVVICLFSPICTGGDMSLYWIDTCNMVIWWSLLLMCITYCSHYQLW